MPDLRLRKTLIWTIVFAFVAIFLSISGFQPLGRLFPLFYVIPPLIAVYFIVRWAVSAGIRDAAREESIGGRRGRVRTGAPGPRAGVEDAPCSAAHYQKMHPCGKKAILPLWGRVVSPSVYEV